MTANDHSFADKTTIPDSFYNDRGPVMDSFIVHESARVTRGPPPKESGGKKSEKDQFQRPPRHRL